LVPETGQAPGALVLGDGEGLDDVVDGLGLGLSEGDGEADALGEGEAESLGEVEVAGAPAILQDSVNVPSAPTVAGSQVTTA
jgi:hypothetical protein